MLTKDIIILVKFIEPQYVRGFMDGSVHFEPLQYFSDKEVEDQDKIIGDDFEGQNGYVLSKDDKIYIFLNDGEKTTKPIVLSSPKGNLKIGLNNTDMKEIGIASFVTLALDNDFDMFDLDKEAQTCSFRIKSEVIDSLKRFNRGKRIPIVIFNVSAFQKMLRKKNLSYGLVKYYDENNIKHMPKPGDSLYKNAFVKRNRYKEQREFRIATRLKNLNKSEEINVGLIHNIGHQFKTVDDLKQIVLFCGGLYGIKEDA